MGKMSSHKQSTPNSLPSNLGGVFLFVALLGVYMFLGHPYISMALKKYLVTSTNQMSTTQGELLSEVPEATYSYYNDSLNYEISSQPSYITGDRTSVVVTDSRTIAMRNFLLDYNSPMHPYADSFITEADKYGLDWRLVASISGVESAFGRLIPPGSYNGWGWKGDPTQAWSHFNGWPDGIATVTKGLSLGYGIRMTPFQIEPIYCPPCSQNPEHAWANGVTRFMNELSYYNSEVK